MSFFCRLSRRHYWCIPHRTADNRLIQVCYECGAERPARELHNEVIPELLYRSTNSSKIAVAKLAPASLAEQARERLAGSEQVAVEQVRIRKLALVK
jgi:hypothetical protein